jgi:medium-chain acyl-[acyl-carrier-protein] hydrolase
MLFNYLQDAATDHCSELGITGMHLQPKGLAWVVYRYRVRIIKYPVWRQDLSVRTWRCPANNLYELRRFEIRDNQGRILLHAKSSWILTRIDTKRPVRLGPNLPEHIMSGHQAPIENDFSELPEPGTANVSRSFSVRTHDLDYNRHVNNTVYAVWAMESVPAATARHFLPCEFQIHYQGEALFGDRVAVHTRPLENENGLAYLHDLYKERGPAVPITRVMTRWQPAEAFAGL